METMVKSRGEDDDTEIHIGLTICEGPGRFRLVLTRPYHEAGRIIEIPRKSIKSVTPIESRALGEEPIPAAE